MTFARTYIDNAPTTSLPVSIDNAITSFAVASLAGFPGSTPYYAVIDLGQASAEIVEVTGVVGSTVTVTRNANGQGSFSHPANVTFQHVLVARDLQDANDHVMATSNVHGVSGNLVGDTDTQTLTDKTLSSPIFTGVADFTGGSTSGLGSSLVAHRNDATIINSVDVSPTHVVVYDESTDIVGTDITVVGGVVTIHRAGPYFVGSCTAWPVGTGMVAAEFFVNGLGSVYARATSPLSGSHQTTVTTSDVITFAVGDTIQLGLQYLDSAANGALNNVLVRSFTVHRATV